MAGKPRLEHNMAPVSVKDELHQMIDAMDAQAALRLLVMLSMADDDGEVTEEEAAEIEAGLASLACEDLVDGADLRRELGIEV